MFISECWQVSYLTCLSFFELDHPSFIPPIYLLNYCFFVSSLAKNINGVSLWKTRTFAPRIPTIFSHYTNCSFLGYSCGLVWISSVRDLSVSVLSETPRCEGGAGLRQRRSLLLPMRGQHPSVHPRLHYKCLLKSGTRVHVLAYYCAFHI